MAKQRAQKLTATGIDTRIVKPRIGHLAALRRHSVERGTRDYHRASSKASFRREDY